MSGRTPTRLKWFGMVVSLIALLFVNMRSLERRLAHEPVNMMVGSEQVPPTLALTTFALGPLRGLIVDGLWWRLIHQQDQGHFFETIQLTDWITSLQPRFPQVWAFNAWNLCYNVAYEFPDPEVRWQWIERSIRLLQKEGLRYNPGDEVIRRELARIFLDRIGKRGDPAQAVFRRFWAEKVMTYLPEGGRAELEALAQALADRERIYAEAERTGLMDRAIAAGYDLRNASAVVEADEDSPGFSGLLDSQERMSAWQSVLAASRALALESDFGYSVSRMLFVDREYGPFDWRLPQAHAVYWSVNGEQTFEEFLSSGDTRLHVMTRQALEQAFQSGRLIYEPETTFFMVTNNLQVFGKVHDYYDHLMDLNPSPNTHELHAEFLSEAAAILYSYQYIDAARSLYEHFREDYVSPGKGPVSFERFIAENLHRVLQGREYSDSRSTIHAALFQAFFWLAAGDRRRASGYHRMARLVYDRHQRQYAGAPAFHLPPFGAMKEAALREIRGSDLAGFLRSRLDGSPEPGDLEPVHPAGELYLGEHGEDADYHTRPGASSGESAE